MPNVWFQPRNHLKPSLIIPHSQRCSLCPGYSRTADSTHACTLQLDFTSQAEHRPPHERPGPHRCSWLRSYRIIPQMTSESVSSSRLSISFHIAGNNSAMTKKKKKKEITKNQKRESPLPKYNRLLLRLGIPLPFVLSYDTEASTMRNAP